MATKPRRAKGGAKKLASPSPVVETIKVLEGLVDAASERINSKPKRKKSMVAKDGTNRGRPTNADKGKAPFDKKAYDRQKARERRAAKKGEAGKAPYAGAKP